jgi:hypothetical protein
MYAPLSLLMLALLSSTVSAAPSPSSVGGALNQGNMGIFPAPAQLHPGAQGEVEFRLNDPAKPSATLVCATLGYDWYPGLAHGLNLTGLVVRRRTTHFGLSGELGVGPGYRHTWFPGPTYRVDEAGEWSRVANPGRAHGLLTFRVGVGYDLSVGQHVVTPFLRMEPQIEAPWAMGLPLNLLTHTQLGVRASVGGSR